MNFAGGKGEFVFFWNVSRYSKWTGRICISSAIIYGHISSKDKKGTFESTSRQSLVNSVLLHITQGSLTQCCRHNVRCSLHLGQIEIRLRLYHQWTGPDFISNCTKTTSSVQYGRFCRQSSIGPIWVGISFSTMPDVLYYPRK